MTILVITALIYIQIGAYAFVAIGTIAILVFPNAIVAKHMHLARKRMLTHTDERLRSVVEFIQVDSIFSQIFIAEKLYRELEQLSATFGRAFLSKELPEIETLS